MQKTIQQKNEGIFGLFKKTIMSGLLVVTPVAITIWLLIKLFLFLDGILSEPSRWLLQQIGISISPEQRIYGPGLLALLLILLLVGGLTRLYIGHRFFEIANQWFEKLPIINTIFSTVQPLSRAIFGGQNDFFREVVWIPYENGYTIGFVIGDAPESVKQLPTEPEIAVYLPFAPPTTGILLYVKKSDLYPANLSVEQALKILFSFGIVKDTDRK
ncbi:MAG: DUF502 domain-containing protein [bacterium]|nr:DUF502 domain-containing protein [bacterium]